MARPELATIVRVHIEYLASQASADKSQDEAPDVRQFPERLYTGWVALIQRMVDDLTPEEQQEIIYYFTVGSTNMDYRSMIRDGRAWAVGSVRRPSRSFSHGLLGQVYRRISKETPRKLL